MSVLTAYKHIVRRVVETRKSGTLCCFMLIKHNLIYKSQNFYIGTPLIATWLSYQNLATHL